MVMDNAIDLLNEKYAKKKTERRIFVITNGQGDSEYSKNHMSCVAGRAKEQGVKINVIAIDFYDEDDDEDQHKPAGPKMSPNQLRNKEILDYFCQLCSAKVFPAQVAFQIYQQFRKPQKKPYKKYNGTFDISNNLRINVTAYTKTT